MSHASARDMIGICVTVSEYLTARRMHPYVFVHMHALNTREILPLQDLETEKKEREIIYCPRNKRMVRAVKSISPSWDRLGVSGCVVQTRDAITSTTRAIRAPNYACTQLKSTLYIKIHIKSAC